MNKDKGWNRGINLLLKENDIVEITIALKHYHDFLCKPKHPDFDWPEVRQSVREIIAKMYAAREIEDNDPVTESVEK